MISAERSQSTQQAFEERSAKMTRTPYLARDAETGAAWRAWNKMKRTPTTGRVPKYWDGRSVRGSVAWEFLRCAQNSAELK